ncbi:protein unc-93 homolog A [Patella vulgata]|uniref:protein unc-93 homolog A n=1 Tax=Patella vulgata TaxID=6465 RepID=UPI00217F9575|nr:protein unc-93 homolog A [Patella vulgata]XP_055957618.1 protein unc-93 homolog A [Patella vulgata]
MDDKKNRLPVPERPLRDTLVLSISFLAIFTSYMTIQGLQSSLNQEAGLGIISLACLYGAFVVSGIGAASFIKILGAKRSLVIGWVVHTLYVASNFYPTWGTLIPSSLLLGGVTGPIWTSQGLYLAANSEAYSRIKNEGMHSALSKLNGIFFMCFEITHVIGNLISSLVLRQSSNADNANNVTRICGADDCPVTANDTMIEQPDQNVVYILLGIFLLCDIFGLCLTVFLLPNLKPRKSNEQTLPKSLVSCCTTLADKKMMLLIPLFFSYAMNQGLLLTEYTKAYISCSLGVSMVGFIMMCYGGSTAIFAILIGHLAQYTGRYFLFVLAMCADMTMLLVFYFWKPNEHQLYLFFIIPSLGALSEAIYLAQFNSLISILFKEKIDSAFANYCTSRALGYTATFITGVFMCLRIRLFIAVALVVISFIGYVGAEFLHSKTKLLQNRKDDNYASRDEQTRL